MLAPFGQIREEDSDGFDEPMDDDFEEKEVAKNVIEVNSEAQQTETTARSDDDFIAFEATQQQIDNED